MTPATATALSAFLEAEYGLRGEAARADGENENYVIAAGDGRRFVLKLAGPDLGPDAVALEHAAVEAAAAADLGVALPRLVPARSGALEASHGGLRGRLLAFVEGEPWMHARPVAPALARDLGRVLARLDVALAAVDVPAARRSHRWDLTRAGRHRDLTALVPDPARRRTLDRAFHLYAAGAAPFLADLPASLIHGDANDENVLVGGGRVTGLIDFGDCLWNPTVCDLAIALAYAMLDEPDPFAVGAEVVAGYHEVRPLSAGEAGALFPLLCGRLATSVATATERRRLDADHPTWFVTEADAWALLDRLAGLDPLDASARLLSAAGITPPAAGASRDDLLDRRRRLIGPSLSLAYREPLRITRGRGQYLFDDRGRPYLDLVNNVCHVGHCHPHVVDAVARQMGRLNTNTRYLYDQLTDYAERLVATLPAPLDTCFFVNSGSEANELALRLARAHTGRRDVVVVDGAYHGHTSTLIAISPYKFMGPGGPGRPEPWVHVAPMPDGYRGPHRGQGREAGVAYGDAVGRLVSEAAAPVACFITESLWSCGGQIAPPEGYLDTAFRHVREAGGVCIVDEVQVGFGRVGTHFWGFERQGVVPDIVVMGKPIGNGHPIGAVVTSRAIAGSFANGMEFFSTFGGNPVSCAAGLAVLDVIRDEDLQAHALEVGAGLAAGLSALMDTCPLIGDVRGAGLFLGVELVRDRATLEPATAEAADLVNRLTGRGILASLDGPFRNVLKIKPPMVLTAGDAGMFVRALGDELAG